MNNSHKALLVLADGCVFEGYAFGAIGTATGEICFNTGMTGYQEVFTDPSYYGQIIIMNTAHVGNYGVKNEDVESKGVKISGLIAKNLSDKYSRTLAETNLDDYLKENKIVSIHGIDTRALVAHIRKVGAMNCIISSDITDLDLLHSKLAAVPSMEGLNLSSYVTTPTVYTAGDSQSKYHVAVLDLGVKDQILQNLINRGLRLTVFPAQTNFDTISSVNPDAYFISNGPGDPASMPEAINTVTQIIATGKPVFGICLGHQLIALANHAKTYKMHHGHRGLNHPVLHLATMKSEITTQNHGFAVDAESVAANNNLDITHINLNDKSLEGLRMKDKPVFSVQYHPEATPGPHDSRYLFDDFISLISEYA